MYYRLFFKSTLYSNSKVNGIDAEDASTIRISLLSLVKIYIYKNIHIEELKQIIAFILANKDEQLVCGIIAIAS